MPDPHATGAVDERTGRQAVDLSILVVTWRTRDLVLAMVRSLVAALDGALADLVVEVIVVDNASRDGTAEALRSEITDQRAGATGQASGPIEVIENERNLGFSGANNQAFVRSTGEVVIVANPDLIVDGEVLRVLHDRVRDDRRIGIATAELVGDDGRRQAIHRALPDLTIVLGCFTRAGRRVDARLLGGRLARRYKLVDRPTTGRHPIGQAAGALMALRRDVVDQIGGFLFDEDLPVLFSDVELCRRVHDTGLVVELDSDLQLAHRGGGSLRQIGLPELDDMQRVALDTYVRRHGTLLERLVTRTLARGRAPTALDDPAPERDDPLVTIVVISYNYAGFLPEAVESALAQDHPAIEVLIVDDGSTDDTPIVAASFRDRGVRSIRQANAGLSAARNFGARHARGRWVVFLDADDRLRPSMVSTLLAAAEHAGTPLAFPQSQMFGTADTVSDIEGWDVERLKRGNYIHAAVLVERALVLAHPYDEANRLGWEDWDFLLTLAENGVRGAFVDETLIDYRRHETNMSSDIRGLTNHRVRARVRRRHRRFVGTSSWLRAERDLLRIRAGLLRRRVFGHRPG